MNNFDSLAYEMLSINDLRRTRGLILNDIIPKLYYQYLNQEPLNPNKISIDYNLTLKSSLGIIKFIRTYPNDIKSIMISLNYFIPPDVDV